MTAALQLPPDLVAALERHETEAHAVGGREVVDLGDALALIDPVNPDPFWNRVVQIRWPTDASAFDRRLADILTMFATRGRRPHVWPSVTGNEPADLVDRLIANGFVDTGRGLVMVRPALDDVDPAVARAADRDEIEVVASPDAAHSVQDAAGVLAESFTSHGESDSVNGESDSVNDSRTREEIDATAQAAERDLARVLADPRVSLVLARVDGAPAAVAKVTGGDGFAYLSSIATHPGYRGRGLGTLVTRAALAVGVRGGAKLAYLGVFEGNEGARRLYERAGFAVVGLPAPDLLLVG